MAAFTLWDKGGGGEELADIASKIPIPMWALFGFIFLSNPLFVLLDWNADAAVNIADAIAQLSHLFGGGPPHGHGRHCTPIEGCPEVCLIEGAP